jgi:hypothetical protein
VILTIGGQPIKHMLPSEQQILTPVPIYIEPPPGVEIKEAELRYKAFGESKYTAVVLREVNRGFGTEIPCDHLTIPADLRFYITLTGGDGEPLEPLGSKEEPLRIHIKKEIEGGPPAIPGKQPPRRCYSD